MLLIVIGIQHGLALPKKMPLMMELGKLYFLHVSTNMAHLRCWEKGWRDIKSMWQHAKSPTKRLLFSQLPFEFCNFSAKKQTPVYPLKWGQSQADERLPNVLGIGFWVL